jgi:hypothetical protein
MTPNRANELPERGRGSGETETKKIFSPSEIAGRLGETRGGERERGGQRGGRGGEDKTGWRRRPGWDDDD